MKARTPSRTFTSETVIAPSPDLVFPLLCPVREYDWIEGWSCELLHSESGLAELGCVFRTIEEGAGAMTWVVTRHEPPRVVEFAAFVADSHVMRLAVGAEPADRATRVRWTRTFTATSERGAAWVARLDEAQQARKSEWLSRALEHYLLTGTKLPRPA